MAKILFEAGSIQTDSKYFKSIVRKKEENGQWNIDKTLVSLRVSFSSPQEAATLAQYDIMTAREKAMANRGTYTMDHYLVALGYQELDQDA
ncbi:hypothetical protein [Chitinivibrio alkaliphilus]|uniref:Uncharacterized protein n=1 Tax=Chitinivibrio alkaliphilus ACht1 TaxID=1313304 RepID=U7D7W6_9BACT|nr:hypothetical protein [Chitinivibrio alkaliphilus]ERP32033.1 hypothetical protein CALK_1014 [Chitinivibrio alkaliphilus ACht1]